MSPFIVTKARVQPLRRARSSSPPASVMPLHKPSIPPCARERLSSASNPQLLSTAIVLDLWAAWQAFRGEEDDEDVSSKKLSTRAVAGVTFVNGGDNIGVYLPVFTTSTPAEVAIYCVVFLILVEPLVWAARFVATRPGIVEALEKWESVLFPAVLILLGIAILLAV